MADRSRLDHTGSDGSSPAERATRAGYTWRVVGENIASGQATPEQAIQVVKGGASVPGRDELDNGSVDAL